MRARIFFYTRTHAIACEHKFTFCGNIRCAVRGSRTGAHVHSSVNNGTARLCSRLLAMFGTSQRSKSGSWVCFYSLSTCMPNWPALMWVTVEKFTVLWPAAHTRPRVLIYVHASFHPASQPTKHMFTSYKWLHIQFVESCRGLHNRGGSWPYPNALAKVDDSEARTSRTTICA